jgi:hypothetical protein
MRLRVIITLFAWMASFAAALAEPERLAVLCDSPDMENLLTAELGALSNVPLVTRSGIPDIVREKLLAGEGINFHGAARVLIVEGEPPNFAARMVESASGATIHHFLLPSLPLDQAAKWLATRISSQLTAPSATAPRISLIGLRFDLDSPEKRVLERNMNLHLAALLAQQNIMVLERWRLRDLVFEKSLDAEESPFWRDAEILDGSLSKDGETLVAHIRLRSPDGISWQKAIRDRTSEGVATAIASAVAEKFGQEPKASRAKSDLEPEAFLDEARWLLIHGLALEAWQAVEAALALGAGGVEPDLLRVQAAAMVAYPDDLRRPETFDGGYNAEAITAAELPVRVAAATEMSLLAWDAIQTHATENLPEWWSLQHPAVFGVHSLYTGLRVLRFAHDSGWHQENRESVRELRVALRRQIDLLKNLPLSGTESIFYSYLTNYAGYWAETPQEAIAFYRKVLDPEFSAGTSDWPKIVRSELAYNSGAAHRPFVKAENVEEYLSYGYGAWRVVAWDDSDPTEAWREFLDELAASPSPISRADSLALRWQSTASKRGRLAITRQMVDFLHSDFETMQGPLGPAIFEQFVMPLRDVNASWELAAAQQRFADFFLRLLESEQALPPGVIPFVYAPLVDGRLNAREDQARTLFDAISRRSANTDPASGEYRQLGAARSALQRQYPNLRETPPDRGCTVAAHGPWIARQHSPDAGFSDEEAVWFDGLLRVLDTHRNRIWSINPATGEASLCEAEHASDMHSTSQLLIWEDFLVVTTQTGVSIFDPENKQWTALGLPPNLYVAGVANGDLWVAAGETQDAGETKGQEGTQLFRVGRDWQPVLVGSSRRRPPSSPLDSILQGRPFVILPSSSGGVLIGGWGNNSTFIDSETALPPEALNRYGLGNMQLSSNPNVIVRTKHKDGAGHRISRIDWFEPDGVKLLLSHPHMDGEEGARFPYPAGLDDFAAGNFTVAWDGTRLGILAWSSRSSPWGATATRFFEISQQGTEEFDIIFPFSPEIESRIRKALCPPNAFQYPHPDPKNLIPTPDGYVIMGRAMSGFWFLPRCEVKAASQP